MPDLTFTVEQDVEIRLAYEAGASLRALANDHGCAPDTIKAAVYRAGGQTRPRQTLQPADDVELRRLYEMNRLSTTQLAEMYGHTDRTIARAIRRAGGTIRPIHERYKMFGKAQRRGMALAYGEGMTAAQVAQRYNCCVAIVYDAVREQGYRVRPTGEARMIQHVFKNGVEGKVCSVCGRWKPLNQYYRAQANSDGLCHQCISCAKLLVSQWRQENQSLVLEQHYRRRAREEDCLIEQGIDIEAIFEEYGNRCAYCGCSDNALTIDHVVPLLGGGAHAGDNLVPACRSCNASKGADSLLAWLAKGGPPNGVRYGTPDSPTSAA